MPEHEQRRIQPFCETVRLQHRDTLVEPDMPLAFAWFPHSGVVSNLVTVEGGESVEVGLVGREGMIGVPLVLGGTENAFHAVVQAEGFATRIPHEPFVHAVLEAGRPFCGALHQYANLFLSTVAQTAACNRLHRIEQRLARWLLDMRDRVDTDDLPATHEFLGWMVGAYRPSITNALKVFERLGLIQIGRGSVRIIDRSALVDQSCECRTAIRQRTAAMLATLRSSAA